MPSYPPAPLGSRFTTTLHTFLQDPGLPFAEVLTAEHIEQAAGAEALDFGSADDEVYSAAVTLWAFLSQTLSGCQSCVAAVARVLVLRVALQLPPCSAATGGYCKARRKLPEDFLRRLTYTVGTRVEDQAPSAWRWRNRRVLLADGAEVTLPDTPDNQEAYPQPRSQRPGVGFPMIRLVVLLTFATASLVGAAFGPHQGKETGETALFRQLFDQLRTGDVVVADRYYCSYFMVALLRELGVQVVFRLHQGRHYDFRRGQRLGAGDHIVVWTKPARPTWLDETSYARLPVTLTVREIRFPVTEPGYRPKEIIVATTLLEAAEYPKKEVADLYHHRWHVELDIRAIKQTLGMDQLRCRSPEMVHRELWVYLLGYNLVRKVLAQAAWQQELSPRQLSFAGALQTLEAFRWLLLSGAASPNHPVLAVVLVAIATHRVGDRPGRWEPRKVKRRPKSYARLMQSRNQEKAKRFHGVQA